MVGWKFTKFLISYLKPKVSFLKTLHHSSVSWKITFLYFLSWNFISFGKKEPIRVLTAHMKFHQIFNLIGPFCWKVYKISTKKIQRSYVRWHWKVMQNLKKILICCFKHDKNLVILTRALETLKNLHTLSKCPGEMHLGGFPGG